MWHALTIQPGPAHPYVRTHASARSSPAVNMQRVEKPAKTPATSQPEGQVDAHPLSIHVAHSVGTLRHRTPIQYQASTESP